MPRDHRLDFGIFVAVHREEADLTGTKVGAAADVTQAKYSDWETCKTLPQTEAQVRAVAKILSIPEDRLLSIWRKAKADTESKGPAIITRAYNVTSEGGGTTSDAY